MSQASGRAGRGSAEAVAPVTSLPAEEASPSRSAISRGSSQPGQLLETVEASLDESHDRGIADILKLALPRYAGQVS